MKTKLGTSIIEYEVFSGARAFTTLRDCEELISVTTGHQIHGDRIAVVDKSGLTRDELQGYDAFITDLKGCPIAVRTADCIPVLLYDRTHHAVAAIHSGWRGTVLEISAKTIRMMSETYGTDSRELRAVIGPGICRECFQVGEEVIQKFQESGFRMEQISSWNGPRIENTLKGGYHIDLIEANRQILADAGIPAENISICGICTYEDRRFFSARREGNKCGRNINVIMAV